MAQSDHIKALLAEQEIFSAPQTVKEKANLQNYDKVYQQSISDNDAFWAEIASDFVWLEPWDKVSSFDGVNHRWFEGAKTNITLNALDRHVENGRKNKLALVWLGEDGSERSVTYGMLLAMVNRLANGLRSLGVGKGDRVVIYMPLTIEGVASMLACARIGAIHSVVYAGFAAGALRARIEDAGAKVVIAGDIGYRRNKTVDLKTIVDTAVAPLDSVEHVVIFWRGEKKPSGERELDFADLLKHPAQFEAEAVDSEHPLYILYTSGTTGKPKGVVHVHGGYMVGTSYHLQNFYDLKDDDVFFCMSDIGWVVGHSYITYAPLVGGVTTIFREGAPDTPHPGIIWEIVEKYGVTAMFTAPTAVRMWMRMGASYPESYDLSSLRILACAGEPLNPEAFRWAMQYITGDHGYVMDNWWQTELGGPTLGTLAVQEHKPGFVGRPMPGVEACIVNEDGEEMPANTGGLLALKRPFPHMLRTIFGTPERYEAAWQQLPGYYLTGDIAIQDEAGRFSVLGRADDVLNVAGHRIGTADVESALVAHAAVAEAAVIGIPDEIKGEAIKAFVVLRNGFTPDSDLQKTLTHHVRNELGPIASPQEVTFVEGLPKTRSGKIMRRLLKARELGQDPGDLSTLES
ncbi:MAG: acetate--CoA ligase [Trueperaceae bacterium]|nr:acetate--CoA ligase [Trueperaceae bacterium]